MIVYLDQNDELLIIQFYKGLKDIIKDKISKEDREDMLEAYIK